MKQKKINPEDSNVYIKQGDEYKPIGIQLHDYLPDGIWYVRHFDGNRSSTNVGYIEGLFRICSAEIPELPQLCGLEEYVRRVMSSKEYCDTLNNPKGCSFMDIVHVVVAQIFKINKQIKNAKIEDE